MPRDALLRTVFAWPTVRTALLIAFVAAPVLTLINQWQAIVGDAAIDWIKGGLTFLVPYVVSTVTTLTQRLRQEAQHVVSRV